MIDEKVKISLKVLNSFKSKDPSIEFVLVELYEEIEEVTLKHLASGFIGKVYALPEPIYPASMALMIQDACRDAFLTLARNPEVWQKTQRLLTSDEQIAITTLIDILAPYFGVPPVCTVSALLIKIGVKHLLGIDKDEMHFEKTLANKLLMPVIQGRSVDQIAMSILAARLHKKKKNVELCQRRLIECENLCRSQNRLDDLNSVGYEYIEIGKVDRGLDLVKEAATIAPDDPGVIDSLAWAHYKCGQFGNALMEIKRALADENKIIQDYTYEGLREVLYHAVVIARKAKDTPFEQSAFSRLNQLDSKGKWISQLS